MAKLLHLEIVSCKKCPYLEYDEESCTALKAICNRARKTIIRTYSEKELAAEVQQIADFCPLPENEYVGA